MKNRRTKWLLAAALAVLLFTVLSPWLVAVIWQVRSSNPVRRGVQRATELGCFHCHGELGRSGIPDPGDKKNDVPAWTGGVWMMYVETDDEIRDYILNGSADRHEHASSPDHQHQTREINMPAFKDLLSGADLEDVVAAFKVVSGMSVPPADTPPRRGYELARQWQCFSCHGAGGSGGLVNPRSFVGFIPGWYGADFEDLVRNREEFDTWVRKGWIPRLAGHPVASFFIRRQRIAMPAYANLQPEELDALWAYTQWLKDTGGGHRGGETPW
jgi:mono/diheme cytochrome c family protein